MTASTHPAGLDAPRSGLPIFGPLSPIARGPIFAMRSFELV